MWDMVMLLTVSHSLKLLERVTVPTPGCVFMVVIYFVIGNIITVHCYKR